MRHGAPGRHSQEPDTDRGARTANRRGSGSEPDGAPSCSEHLKVAGEQRRTLTAQSEIELSTFSAIKSPRNPRAAASVG